MSTSTMPSKKAKGFTIVDAIQRGDLSVVEAFGQLSRVFAAEVLPKQKFGEQNLTEVCSI